MTPTEPPTPGDEPELEKTHPTPVDRAPDLVAGRYRIVRPLGRGGGGQVWLATDEHLGREVTLKRVGGETDPELLVSRGLREARTLATIAHEHVVRVYDAFEHEGAPWIVMEYVPGLSLADLLADHGQLPVPTVAGIGAQLATALAAAHRAGIVHRDVKPGNVLLTDDTGEHAKLTDFGIARSQDDHQLTQTGLVSGTAAYFSPELAGGEEPTTASDVWALGATLYAAVEGRRPFPDRPNAVAQLHTIVREAPRPPQQAGSLAPVLAGMLEPDPQRRWTADQCARALTSIAAGDTPRGTGVWGAAAPPPDSGGAGAAAAAAAAAARARSRGGEPTSSTQQVQPVDDTASLPVARPGKAGSGPTAYPPDRGHQQRPRPTQRPAPPPRGAEQPPPARATPRRRGRLLTWLLVVPLLAALGWFVWTVVQEGGWSPGGDPAPTETVDGAVTGAEAEEVVRFFYTTLASDSLEAARAVMIDAVPVGEQLEVDLQGVEIRSVSATEQADGTVAVLAVVAYNKGGAVPVVQEETMIVERRGEAPMIVRRETTEIDP